MCGENCRLFSQRSIITQHLTGLASQPALANSLHSRLRITQTFFFISYSIRFQSKSRISPISGDSSRRKKNGGKKKGEINKTLLYSSFVFRFSVKNRIATADPFLTTRFSPRSCININSTYNIYTHTGAIGGYKTNKRIPMAPNGRPLTQDGQVQNSLHDKPNLYELDSDVIFRVDSSLNCVCVSVCVHRGILS